MIPRRFASLTEMSVPRPVDSCDSSGISHRRSSFSQPAERVVDTGRRTWPPELLPQFLEALVRSLIGDEPAIRPQPDTGERQQQHQRLVGCPTAMASVDPDGGQAFEELIGGHDDLSLSCSRMMRRRPPPHHPPSPNTSSTARTLNSPGSKSSPIHSFMCSWFRAFGSFRASSIS